MGCAMLFMLRTRFLRASSLIKADTGAKEWGCAMLFMLRTRFLRASSLIKADTGAKEWGCAMLFMLRTRFLSVMLFNSLVKANGTHFVCKIFKAWV